MLLAFSVCFPYFRTRTSSDTMTERFTDGGLMVAVVVRVGNWPAGWLAGWMGDGTAGPKFCSNYIVSRTIMPTPLYPLLYGPSAILAICIRSHR